MFSKLKINWQLVIRRACLIISDIIFIIASSLLALGTRFEFHFLELPPEFTSVLWKYEIPFIIITLVVFWIFRIYHSLWEYAGMEESINVVMACIVANLVELALVVFTQAHLPRSYYVLSTMYLMAFVGASRFMYRLLRMKRQSGWSFSKKRKSDGYRSR